MRLIHERGGERIAYPIEEGETYIGRKDYCDIHLPDTSLSKRHARLVRKGRSLSIFDAGSRNGTLVNDELVEGEFRLENGDVIQLGKLRFLVDGIPDASGAEFEILEEAAVAGGSRSASGGSRLRARAVASHEVRPSMLDVLPEVPPSVDGVTGSELRPTARFRLVEGGEEQVWDLDGETVTIGSKGENAIVLKGEGISRYHAEVVQEDGVWLLKDLGARNGLFVRGERIDIHELRDGDEVQIGTAKLRFELLKASPMAGLQEVIERIKADPVAAIKEDQRVRMGLAAAVTALVLLLMAVAGGGPPKPPEDSGVSKAWVEEGTKHLEAGGYDEAEDVFRKAVSHGVAVGPQRELARSLSRLAEEWQRSDDPNSFRWEQAGGILDGLLRKKDLPRATVTWLERQQEWVALNAAAYETLRQAENLGREGGDAASQRGRYKHALTRFRETLQRYRDIPPQSVFAARAADQAKGVRRQIHQLVVDEVGRQKDTPSPRWDQIAEIALSGLEYAETPEQRARLRQIAEDAEINRRDEERYMRAVDIVQLRDVPNYPVAVRLLQQIDRRSLIYPDAQAYISWIDADLKVRQARKAYDMGDHRRAFLLLNQSLQHDILGPEARKSVRERRQKWSRVVSSYQRGMRAYNDGRLQEAKADLKRVIEAEPSQQNRFVQQAQAQIKHIIDIEAWGLERKLREGFDALDHGEYSDAIQWFNQASQDPNKTPRDIMKIQQAVANANRRRHLFVHAEQLLIRDRTEKFIELYYTFKLLMTWLPPGHADVEKSQKYFEQVRSRLNTVLQSGPGQRR